MRNNKNYTLKINDLVVVGLCVSCWSLLVAEHRDDCAQRKQQQSIHCNRFAGRCVKILFRISCKNGERLNIVTWTQQSNFCRLILAAKRRRKLCECLNGRKLNDSMPYFGVSFDPNVNWNSVGVIGWMSRVSVLAMTSVPLRPVFPVIICALKTSRSKRTRSRMGI